MIGQKYQDPKIEERTDVKNPYYFIRASVPVITANGLEYKRTPLRIGPSSGKAKITMREAKAMKEQIMAPINGSKFLVQSQIQLGLVLDKYEAAHIPTLGSAAQDTYGRHIRLHIRPEFGLFRMCDVSKLAVQTWINKKESAGLGHEMLKDLRKVLHHVYSWAEENELWEGKNPCRGLTIRGRKEIYSKTLPEPDGLLRFLASMPDTAVISADGARLIVVTDIASGMRPSEILGLQPRVIDPLKQTVSIERRWARGNIGPTKTPESRRIRQIPGLAAELLRYARGKAPDAFIFGREDRNGDPPDDRDLQQHVFRPAAEASGIYSKGFGLYRFRHLNITWRQEVGASTFEAQKAAGHSQPSTTWAYTHVNAERERQHVSAIMDRLIVSEGRLQ